MKLLILGSCASISAAMKYIINKNDQDIIVFAREGVDITDKNEIKAIEKEVFYICDYRIDKMACCGGVLANTGGISNKYYQHYDDRMNQLPKKQTYTPKIHNKTKRW